MSKTKKWPDPIHKAFLEILRTRIGGHGTYAGRYPSRKEARHLARNQVRGDTGIVSFMTR